MNYSINGGRKYCSFETELQISSYSTTDTKRSLSVGRSGKKGYKGYEELGNCWFESGYIHFHVIGDTICITINNEEAIRSIREMLENAGIEVKGN